MCSDSEMCNGIDPARFTFAVLTEAALSLDFIISLNLTQRNEIGGKLHLVCHIVLSAHFKYCVSDSPRDFDKASNPVVPEVQCVTGILHVGQDDVFEQEQEIGPLVSQVRLLGRDSKPDSI